MFALAPFYLVIFGVPVAVAAFVFFAGIGREEIRGVHVFVLGSLAGLLVWAAVAVRQADGAPSYAGFLRLTALVAVVGAAASAYRAVAQRRAARMTERSAQPAPRLPEAPAP